EHSRREAARNPGDHDARLETADAPQLHPSPGGRLVPGGRRVSQDRLGRVPAVAYRAVLSTPSARFSWRGTGGQARLLPGNESVDGIQARVVRRGDGASQRALPNHHRRAARETGGTGTVAIGSARRQSDGAGAAMTEPPWRL